MDPRLKQRFAQLHATLMPYAVISFDPPIFYIQLHGNALDRLLPRYEMLFSALEGRRAWCIFCYSFDLTPWLVRGVVEMQTALLARFPNLELSHAGNTAKQCELLASAGLRAIFCNQNCFIDESVFRPDSRITKRFDAVYDATLTPLKRHHLAQEVESLALIYYPSADEDPAYVAEVKRQFATAHYFNHDLTGSFRILAPAEVASALNASRVGLCLSQQEGAMWASAQYLLCGLPIVTTQSEGGREEFFDVGFVRTVAEQPAAVAHAVRELIDARLDPEQIRQATLEKFQLHRNRFIALVQELYDRSGTRRHFQDEWPGVFFNRMIAVRSHHETIARLRRAWAGTDS